MTVTRMATPRGPIPVTVDTFEASGGTGGGDTRGGGGGNAERRRIQRLWLPQLRGAFRGL